MDSEELVQSIQSVGFSMVPEGTKEEVTVLNTCSFIQAAIDETEDNIQLLIDRKTTTKSNTFVWLVVTRLALKKLS